VSRQRFVLRYRGEGPKPQADVERVRHLPGATVIDETPGRMVLVESDEGPLRELVESLPDWVAAPEQMIPVPDTRKRVTRPPD
jgi:hypothetical protein